jgi:Glu-tRNA(Gln) amidotransferase subunit E-like FAD-binding protein
MAKPHAVQEEEKSRGGRPKKEGRVPQVTLSEAIANTKKAYEKDGMAHNTLSGMAEAMQVNEAFARRAFGEMTDQYGLITREDDGAWHVTDLGRRAVTGDKSAVIEVFCKNEIMRELYNRFKEREIKRDLLVQYIRSNRLAYKITPESIADKFLDGLNLIAGIVEDTRSMKQQVNVDSKQTIQNFLKLVQLQYALNPPNKSAVSKLASDIAKSLDKDKESALRTLGSSIHNHKDEEKILQVVVANALEIMKDKYSGVLGDMEAANDGEDNKSTEET